LSFPTVPFSGCDVGEILAALRDTALVAGSVLSADQAVGPALTAGANIQIGAGRLDLSFNVAAHLLGCLERPCLG
jgi:hypothetical protein